MVRTRGLQSAKVKKLKPNGSTESKRNRVEESANAKAAPVASGRKKRAYSSSEEEESPSPVVSMQKKKPRMAEEPKAKRLSKEPSKSVGGISYKWHSEELFFGRINQNSRLQYLSCIENTLTRTDWQTVLQGPFGPIIKIMKNMKLSAQLIHHVLFRQLDTKKQFETWYDLGGQPCRFSIEEFRLITGLNCGMPDEEDSMQDKNALFDFFGVRSITIANLLTKFLSYREDNVYKLKMALLLILEGVVLEGDKKRKVRPLHVKLTQDLDHFNNFPWGRSAYIDLHQSLASALDTRMESVQAALVVSDNARAGYTIRGFPMVFQIWLYEAVPHIGRTFAQKLNKDVQPRGVRWLKSSRPSLDAIYAALEGKFPTKQILVEEDGEELGESCYFPEEEGHKSLDDIVKHLKPRRKRAGKKDKGVGKGGQAGNIEGFDPRQFMCCLNEMHQMIHALKEGHDLLRDEFIKLNKFIRGKARRTGASSSSDQHISTHQELSEEFNSDNEPNITQHQQSMREVLGNEAKTKSEANDEEEKMESEDDEDNESKEGESEETETDEETMVGEQNTGKQEDQGEDVAIVDEQEDQGDATHPLSVLVKTCTILHADEKMVNETTPQDVEGLIKELVNDELVNDGTVVATQVEVATKAVSDEGVHDRVVEELKEAIVKGGSKVDDGGVDVEDVAKGADVEGRTKVDDQVVEEPKGDVEGLNTVDEGVMEESTGDVVEGGTKVDELGVEARTEIQGEKVSQADFDDVGGDEGETKESKVSRKGRPRKGSQVSNKTYPSRTRELAAKAKSPYRNIDEQKLEKKITKNSKVEGMTELVKWMQSESIEPRTGPGGQSLDNEFFKRLFAPKIWLRGEHLAQMMVLYRQRILEDPQRFSKVVVLDPFWQNYVKGEFDRFQNNTPLVGKDELILYMMGSCPQDYGKRWDDAERIYACFNITEYHWFALEIDLCDWCVTVYDCNVDLHSDKDIFDMIRPIVETVLRYVKMYEPLAKRCEPFLDNPMSVSHRDNLKQNKRGGDCGVYTLKYIELLILGMSNLDLASDKFIDAHRSQMAHSIFRCCWDGL